MGPFSSYKGDGPYIFVCYAHADAALVYPQMSWLREQGVNIWYDEGISPGELWRSEVAHAIEHSSLFLFFVSPNSMARADCLREIDYALDRLRPFLSVHLAATVLSPPLRPNRQCTSASSRWRRTEWTGTSNRCGENCAHAWENGRLASAL